jgi:hypothetical protein
MLTPALPGRRGSPSFFRRCSAVPDLRRRRGGCRPPPQDGGHRVPARRLRRLNTVVPYGEKGYYALRPSIAILAPRGGKDAALDPDGPRPAPGARAPCCRYGRRRAKHRSRRRWEAPTRHAHFDAQDFMESGTRAARRPRTDEPPPADDARSASDAVPGRGPMPTLPCFGRARLAVAMSSIREFGPPSGGRRDVARAFEDMYGGAVRDRCAGPAARHSSHRLEEAIPRYQPGPALPTRGARRKPGRLCVPIAWFRRSRTGRLHHAAEGGVQTVRTACASSGLRSPRSTATWATGWPT